MKRSSRSRANTSEEEKRNIDVKVQSKIQTELNFKQLNQLEKEIQALRVELQNCKDENNKLRAQFDEVKREITVSIKEPPFRH